MDGKPLDFNLLELLLTGNATISQQEFYEISRHRRFTFDLTASVGVVTANRCDIYQLDGLVKRKSSRFRLKELDCQKRQSEAQTRLQTYLNCQIQHGQDKWTLLLLQDYQNTPQPRLIKEGDEFKLELFTEYQTFTRRKGVERLRSREPGSPNNFSAMTFGRGDRQLAAVSLLDNAGFWVASASGSPPGFAGEANKV